MAVIMGMLNTLGDNGAPIARDGIPSNLVWVEFGCPTGDVHQEIHASFPLQETELSADVEEGQGQDLVVEDGRVDCMDVKEVEFDGL